MATTPTPMTDMASRLLQIHQQKKKIRDQIQTEKEEEEKARTLAWDLLSSSVQEMESCCSIMKHVMKKNKKPQPPQQVVQQVEQHLQQLGYLSPGPPGLEVCGHCGHDSQVSHFVDDDGGINLCELCLPQYLEEETEKLKKQMDALASQWTSQMEPPCKKEKKALAAIEEEEEEEKETKALAAMEEEEEEEIAETLTPRPNSADTHKSQREPKAFEDWLQRREKEKKALAAMEEEEEDPSDDPLLEEQMDAQEREEEQAIHTEEYQVELEEGNVVDAARCGLQSAR